jgi:ribosomal protein L34
MVRTYQPKKRQRKKRARLPEENGHKERRKVLSRREPRAEKDSATERPR